jgi:putative nucleotidyltransferase with HDIG domain
MAKEKIEKVYEDKITKRAIELLWERFPEWETQPSSLSGMFHGGDSMGEHLRKAVNIMKHLCDCFDIPDEDRDMLIAATYLHDIGKYTITSDVSIERHGWKYFPRTRYSRLEALMKIHGPVGAAVLADYKIDRKEEIKGMIASHMGHWSSDAPQPITFYQHLVCIADYLSSRDGTINDYTEKL